MGISIWQWGSLCNSNEKLPSVVIYVVVLVDRKKYLMWLQLLGGTLPLLVLKVNVMENYLSGF